MTAPAPEINIEKIIERAQKLNKMAESAKAVGSLQEAEAFMEGLQKTLAYYNLDSSVLSMDLKDKNDPMSRKGVPSTAENYKKGSEQWAWDLAEAVAAAHYCVYHVASSGNYVFFYGRKSNVDVTYKMFVYLRDMALRLGTAAYLKEEQRLHRVNGSARGAADYKWNWFKGFSREVAERYKAMRQRLESDKGMSLVLVGVRKEASEYSQKFLSKGGSWSPNPKGAWISPNEKARRDGQEAARNANLRPHNLDGDAVKSPKLIK